MKCCYAIEYLICFAMCFTYAELERLDLNDFFEKLAKDDHHTLSNKVFIETKQMSLNDYFKVSNPKSMVVKDHWPITTQNVYEVSRLLNVVMSCDYCKKLYYILSDLNKKLDNCCSTKPRASPSHLSGSAESTRSSYAADEHYVQMKNCYNSIQNEMFEPVANDLSSMILTLTGLQGYTKNFVSKKHDALKILLVLYLSFQKEIKNGPEKKTISKDTFLAKLKNLKVVFVQIKLYLERFIIANCYYSETFEDFKLNIHQALFLNEKPSSPIFIHTKDISPITHESFTFLSRLKSFVVCPDDTCFENVFVLIESTTELAAGDTDTENYLKNLKKDYYASIADSTDIVTILKYELLLLQTITKIIIRIIVHALNDILDDENVINKYDSCKNSIQIDLERYKDLLKLNGQPYYLTDKMILISHKLWFICYKMKSGDVRTHINDLDTLSFNYPTKKADLLSFLGKMSQYVICSKLHPAITNAFWGRMYIYKSNIFEYMIDFKPVQTSAAVINDKNFFCDKIETILSTTATMNQLLDECDKIVNGGDVDVESIVTCFTRFNDQCKELQIYVSSVNEKCFPDGSMEWQKMITLIDYNLKYMESFNIKVQKSMDGHRIKSIKNFVSDIVGGVRAQNEIYCVDGGMVPTDGSPAIPSLRSLLGSSEGERNMPKIATANGPYEEHFHSLSDLAKEIIFDDRLEEDFKLYRDGVETTFYEVYNYNTKYAHDLQDGYDLHIFMIKWILTVLYTRIRDIIELMMFFKIKIEQSYIDRLCGCLGPIFQNLPLFTYIIPDYVFSRFLTIIKEFDGSDIQELESFQTLLNSELDFIGIVSDSIPNMLDGIDARVQSLETNITILIDIYDRSKSKMDRIKVDEKSLMF